jgi:hypothetical protein
MTRIPAIILGVGLLTSGLSAAVAAPGSSTAAPTAHHAAATAAGEPYTHALNMIEAAGYTGVTNLTPNGENFDASAYFDGHPVKVTLDPATGAVHTRE